MTVPRGLAAPRAVGAIAVAVWLAAPQLAGAQGVEISPFTGYRFGGDFFELMAARPIDRDGAPVLGCVVDVPISAGLQFEAFFTHQSADIPVPDSPSGPTSRWRFSIDHIQAGGLQEFGAGKVKPFLTGMLGLTHYSAAGDNELRFSLSGGGGVKLFPASRLGVRFDGRLSTTFVDFDGRVTACAVGWCFLDIHTETVWQAEFTAGLVVRLR